MLLPQRLTKIQSMVVVGGVIIALAVVVWYLPAFFPEEFHPETIAPETTSKAAIYEQRRIKILFSINDTLQDPRWKNLQVFGKPVKTIPLGRSNPFAPLPSTGSSTSNLPPELIRQSTQEATP